MENNSWERLKNQCLDDFTIGKHKNNELGASIEVNNYACRLGIIQSLLGVAIDATDTNRMTPEQDRMDNMRALLGVCRDLLPCGGGVDILDAILEGNHKYLNGNAGE